MKRPIEYIGDFRGFPVVSKTTPAEKGSDRWNELCNAISGWRKASLSNHYGSAVCENAARELEIERDHGVVVHINTRC